MHQALHIFRKDIRYLRIEIAFLVTIPVLIVWTASRVALRGALFAFTDVLEFLAAAVFAYVITRLIHAETIPGQNQFWLTRPYRWQSLLTAKLLFILCFINLPFLLIQTALLLSAGFPFTAIVPGLLWTQVLLFFGVALPLTALAALTSGIAQFMGAILSIILAAVLVLNRTNWSTPQAVEWLRDAIIFVTVLLVVPPILLLQYRDRNTRLSRILAIAIGGAGLLAYVVMPWPALFAVQSSLSKQAVDLKITPVPTMLAKGFGPPTVTLNVQGIPEGLDLQIQDYRASITDPAGRTAALSLVSDSHDPTKLHLGLDGRYNYMAFEPGQKITLRATFYITLFGNSRDETFQLTNQPTTVMNTFRCFAGYRNQMECNAPFRWPRLIVSQKTTGGALSAMTRLISYSPFPSGLNLQPIVSNGLVYYSEKPQPLPRQVTLNTKEPVAYLRRDVEFRDLEVAPRSLIKR